MCYYLTTPSIANIVCRWPMNTEYGALLEWYWQGKNPGTWIETCFRGVLCSSQNGLAWNRTRTLPMIDHRLTVGAMARLHFLTTQNSLSSWQLTAPPIRESGTLTTSLPPPPAPPVTNHPERVWFVTISWCYLQCHFHLRHSSLPCLASIRVKTLLSVSCCE